MSTIYDYLTDIKARYYSIGKSPNLIAFVHEENEYDKWTLIVSGNGITNSKRSMDEAYDIVNSSLNGRLPDLIRSIYTLTPDSALVTDIKEYLKNLKMDDSSSLKQINRFGITDGLFIIS